jgi:hypothetical protein
MKSPEFLPTCASEFGLRTAKTSNYTTHQVLGILRLGSSGKIRRVVWYPHSNSRPRESRCLTPAMIITFHVSLRDQNTDDRFQTISLKPCRSQFCSRPHWLPSRALWIRNGTVRNALDPRSRAAQTFTPCYHQAYYELSGAQMMHRRAKQLLRHPNWWQSHQPMLLIPVCQPWRNEGTCL